MKPLLLSLLLATSAYAQSVAPTLSQTNRGLELAVPLEAGTPPLSYQWYRETGTIKKKRVAIPAPEGVQPTLTLSAPHAAGTYFCEVTNAAGTVTSRPVKLSVTKVKSAPEMSVTVKQP